MTGKKAPQTEHLVQVIREAILSNKFEPGERLNESHFANQTKTSRSPVREAIQRLAGEGLLTFVPGRGAFVARFDLDEIKELFEIREAIDGMAARLAAERGKPRDIQRLVDILDLTEVALTNDAMPTYPLDLDFHQKVLDTAYNDRLRDHGYEIHTQLRLARSRSGYRTPRASEAFVEHRRILDAIKARDAAAAEEAMREHVRHAFQSVSLIFATKSKQRS